MVEVAHGPVEEDKNSEGWLFLACEQTHFQEDTFSAFPGYWGVHGCDMLDYYSYFRSPPNKIFFAFVG